MSELRHDLTKCSEQKGGVDTRHAGPASEEDKATSGREAPEKKLNMPGKVDWAPVVGSLNPGLRNLCLRF